ncbi:MAG TPA: chromosomal replication initiator protein DnaA, partial [Rhodospirillaceae bacterium]|nr:chromosomal replication initiator protein DnaA [Rhodospirillaceae bacterium]
MNDEIVRAQWNRVRGRLRDEFGDATFKSWLNPLSLSDVSGGQVRISVPTRFLRDWVITHYGDRIRALWSKENATVNGVDIVVQPTARTDGPPTAPERRPHQVAPARPAVSLAEPANVSDDISAALDPRYTFDNFVVGKPNEFAHAAARRVAESDTVSFNPLFLYGGVGLG